jgi:hypothetical protein
VGTVDAALFVPELAQAANTGASAAAGTVTLIGRG